MKISFIGGGNMGGAIIGGIISAGLVKGSDVMVSDKNQSSLDALADKFGINTTTDNTKAVEFCDILFLSVKPNVLPMVAEEIKTFVNASQVVVSIVAGQSIERIFGLFEKEFKLVRVMPNTPALVGEGMSALTPSEQVTKDELDTIIKIFESFGQAEIVPEKLQDVVVGISGSSPAYVFMFIEAMADAAVAEGMPRAQAYKFASQAVLGSAKMALETGRHPGDLKDMVCSPGGTTIEAVAELEARGFRSAVIEAERVCIEKSRNL